MLLPSPCILTLREAVASDQAVPPAYGRADASGGVHSEAGVDHAHGARQHGTRYILESGRAGAAFERVRAYAPLLRGDRSPEALGAHHDRPPAVRTQGRHAAP